MPDAGETTAADAPPTLPDGPTARGDPTAREPAEAGREAGGDGERDRADGEPGDGEGSEPPGEELPDPGDAATDTPAAVTLLSRLQDVVYYGIAVVLLAVGAVALARTGLDFVAHDDVFAHRVTAAVNGVLFVVIVLELLRTVLAHFDDATFHLKPFLIIGIISVVRHILTVGAELSLEDEGGGGLLHRSDVELGVNALVVVALVVGLVLVRKTE